MKTFSLIFPNKKRDNLEGLSFLYRSKFLTIDNKENIILTVLDN